MSKEIRNWGSRLGDNRTWEITGNGVICRTPGSASKHVDTFFCQHSKGRKLNLNLCVDTKTLPRLRKSSMKLIDRQLARVIRHYLLQYICFLRPLTAQSGTWWMANTDRAMGVQWSAAIPHSETRWQFHCGIAPLCVPEHCLNLNGTQSSRTHKTKCKRINLKCNLFLADFLPSSSS